MYLIKETIGECLNNRVKLTPDMVGAAYEEESFTWKEMDIISDYFAIKCLKSGMNQGTHVGIWGVNSISWIVHFLALEKIGAVPVLLNICYREKELEDILRYADVEYLLRGIRCKDVDYEQVVNSLNWDRLPLLKEVIQMEQEGNKPNKDREHYILSREDQLRLDSTKKKVTSDHIACMLFTSGTTSIPKGVLLTHYSLINNARQHVTGMGWTSQDKICVSVPLFHCFGVTVGILSALCCGASLQLVKYYKSKEVLRTIETYRCTVLNGVPSMFLALVNNKEFADYDISSIQSGILAGSYMPSGEYKKLCRLFHHAKLQPAYGQTEASPCITMADYGDNLEKKASSCGKPIPWIDVRIVDHDKRQVMPPEKRGEIEVRGYNVMYGYYQLPDVQRAVKTEDGWLRTGDEGYFDQEGYLHITGRLKEIIIRGGENISPTEVEEIICNIPGIDQVKVMGMPVKIMQEKVVACIICREDMNVGEEQVRSYVAQQLASYKVPEHVLVFEKFPMTSSGKVNQKELKRQAARILSK